MALSMGLKPNVNSNMACISLAGVCINDDTACITTPTACSAGHPPTQALATAVVPVGPQNIV